MKALIAIDSKSGLFEVTNGKHEAADYTQFIRDRDKVAGSANAEVRWAFYLAPAEQKPAIREALKAGEKDGKTGEFTSQPWTDSKVNQMVSDSNLLHLIVTGTFPASTSLDTLKTVRRSMNLQADAAGNLLLDESKLTDAGKAVVPLLKDGKLTQAAAKKALSEVLVERGGTKKPEPPAVVEAKPLTAEEVQTEAETKFRQYLQLASKKLEDCGKVDWSKDPILPTLTGIVATLGFKLVVVDKK